MTPSQLEKNLIDSLSEEPKTKKTKQVTKTETFTQFDTDFIPDTRIYPHMKKAVEKGYSPLVVGPPGCGKSRMFEEIASHLGIPCRRFSLDIYEDHTELIGKDAFMKKETVFQKGELIQCFEQGIMLIMDELDRASEAAVRALNMVLEKNGKITVMTIDKGPQDFIRHPQSRIVFTANTWCRGDDTGLFQGTSPVNRAFLSRIGPKFAMDYNVTIEKDICQNKGLPEETLKMLFDKDPNDPSHDGVVHIIRRAIQNREIDDFLTTRALIQFSECFADHGWNVAFETCIINDFDPVYRNTLRQMVTRRLGEQYTPRQ